MLTALADAVAVDRSRRLTASPFIEAVNARRAILGLGIVGSRESVLSPCVVSKGRYSSRATTGIQGAVSAVTGIAIVVIGWALSALHKLDILSAVSRTP